jgi:hypothetical protein
MKAAHSGIVQPPSIAVLPKAPGTHIQAPEKHQDPSIKRASKSAPERHYYSNSVEADVWSLEFGTSLEIGAWNLELIAMLREP